MFLSLLKEIATALDAASIPYMVIGGQAVLRYGEPRLTKDIGVMLGVSPDRAAEIAELIQGLNFRVLPESPVDFANKMLVLPCVHEASGVPVDFVFSCSPYEPKNRS